MVLVGMSYLRTPCSVFYFVTKVFSNTKRNKIKNQKIFHIPKMFHFFFPQVENFKKSSSQLEKNTDTL